MSYKSKVLGQIKELTEKENTMKEYLDLKRKDEDWHGVWDAAVELDGIVNTLAHLDEQLEEIERCENYPKF